MYIGLRKTLEKAERLCVTREYVRTCLQALQAPHKRFVSETDMDIRGPDYRGKKLKWAYLLWLFDAYGVKVQFMPSRMFDQFLEDVGEGNIDNMGQHVAMRITPVEALSADRLSRRTIKFRLPTEEENVEYFGYVDEVIHELGLEQL